MPEFFMQTARIPQMIPPARNLDLRHIYQRYPAVCRPESAEVPQSAQGFSGACIWEIGTRTGACALRAVGASSIDTRRLSGLHRLLAHVRASGVTQVAPPIAALDGATFFEFDGLIWQLEAWMPGSADFSSRPSEIRLRAALSALAEWHRAAAGFVPRDAEAAWFFTSRAGPSPGLARRAQEISRWGGPEGDRVRLRMAASSWNEFAELGHEILDNFGRAAPRVAGQLMVGLETQVPLQPCLRDIWHDHVLFSFDEVTGLIDPHSARSDSVATDLARLLGSLVGDDRRLWESGIDAYQQVRRLSPSELALLEVFDQTAVLLSGMTWLDWICLQGRVFEDREKVINRLQAIASRLRILASR
jgi:Ser/Thr protein kinase RdoA (MazF antagonist)